MRQRQPLEPPWDAVERSLRRVRLVRRALALLAVGLVVAAVVFRLR